MAAGAFVTMNYWSNGPLMRCSCVIPAALFLLMSFVFFCDYELWIKRPFDTLFLCYSRCTVSADEFCILL